MGRAKQLVEADGEPLVVRALRLALSADVDEALVVTGAYADEVDQALQPWLAQAGSRVRLVHNPAWASGQASSMHAALAALSPATQAVLFLPVDQPRLPVSLLLRLARLWRAGWAMAAPSADSEVRGAPALFDRTLWLELLAVRGDRGGRGLLRAYPQRVGSVAVDGSLLADMDTRQDLASLSTGG